MYTNLSLIYQSLGRYVLFSINTQILSVLKVFKLDIPHICLTCHYKSPISQFSFLFYPFIWQNNIVKNVDYKLIDQISNSKLKKKWPLLSKAPSWKVHSKDS